MRLGFIAIVATAALTGCAVGNQHVYHDSDIGVSYQGSRSVAVTAVDKREYVLSGEKQPDFVGLSRGGFGNPFNVTTASGNPLATDITEVVSEALSDRGFKTLPVVVNHNEDMIGINAKLKDTGTDRWVIVTLTNWKSDTFQNTALIYDVTLSVMDGNGQQLAMSHIEGRDNLAGSWNPPAHAKKAVPVAFKEKFEQLLNDETIAAALR